MADGAAACAVCGAPAAAGHPYPPPPGTPGTSAQGRPYQQGQTQTQYGQTQYGQTQYGQPPAGAPQPAQPRPAFSFDASRWSRDDRITGIATAVLFLSLFAPWFSYTVVGAFGLVGYNGTVDGIHAGFMWLVFLISLAVIAYLILQAGYAELPFKLPASRELLLLAATGIDCLLVVIAFFMKSAPGSAIGYSFGAFLGLFAAIAALVPQVLPYFRGSRSSS